VHSGTRRTLTGTGGNQLPRHGWCASLWSRHSTTPLKLMITPLKPVSARLGWVSVMWPRAGAGPSSTGAPPKPTGGGRRRSRARLWSQKLLSDQSLIHSRRRLPSTAAPKGPSQAVWSPVQVAEMPLDITKLDCPAAGLGSGLRVVIGVAGALFGQRVMDPGNFVLGRGKDTERGAQLRA